jgi:putative ABC transport system substrate-binding protein
VLMAFAESNVEGQNFVAAFREGLQKLGWTEGRNIRIDTRWAAADVELMQRFAQELVAVGTRVTSRPPHRSVHAAFPHTAPT